MPVRRAECDAWAERCWHIIDEPVFAARIRTRCLAQDKPSAAHRAETDPQRTGNRAEGYPNTHQGPVARLVGRYAVRLIERI
jgi:hypothetical protein